ncbi:glycoside hydrolase family 16 protein [Collybiopsis luxurians FD-317 M1]|uniref:Unplaced genomic scaffold GYMLUscaffold_20, whole genome shotgun sequence n=1 Tax=Collybiopsis luxurians FD-317 M1 TaxID=944289 RepID=A0A0D0D026_9AGAR|nr:glycoside hydrolase family 16 protein [Collybiopsis luxurians FD-317 M1]
MFQEESDVPLLQESSRNIGYGPYPSATTHTTFSITAKYSLAPDPQTWGSSLFSNIPEPDDVLHDPSARKRKWDEHGLSMLSSRAISNLKCLVFLVVVLLSLFIGYPILTFAQRGGLGSATALNAKVNGSGQVPSLTFGLIDVDTPSDAYTTTSIGDGSTWKLVFSDEFNTDGRTFYPGDDPYWEVINLHYWETNNLEWYDPAAITTANGSLVITYSQQETHNLSYQGGMMSTWNKFCFTGGYFEASVMLPGINNVAGMWWPAIWTLGNLGRAGYGVTLDGMWPYTYDSCDVGTAPNQTHNGLPAAALNDGDASTNFALSYLPGQRLSRCTCPGESHPGPVHSDGTYVGRSAPEIDMFEAQITGSPLSGQVSQSAQWAPFNDQYIWLNTSENLVIPNPSISVLNSYIGGDTQQATSVVTNINQDCYELSDNPCYATYGFEYKPGFDNAYITWVASGTAAWTLNVAGMGADTVTEISARPIAQEPMYLIINLGMSENFGTVDFEHLTFPNHLRVDYVRVYQDPQNINIGCDPTDFPTADYINTYLEAYTNPNLTTWVDDFKQPWPKNSFVESC